MTKTFTATVLMRFPGDFFFCRGCGYLGVPDPYWLEQAYSSAIATMDTGVVTRNAALARRCIPIMYSLLKPDPSNHRCLDFAAGYGLFARLMRDAGFDYYWIDKYSDNLFARGFEYDSSAGPCSIVTAFEVLEHAVDPVGLVAEAMAMSSAKTFIFTTELFSGVPPAPDDWWYYAFETGQHISFFQERTLKHIANELGLHFYSRRGIHCFSKEPVGSRLWFSGGIINRILAAAIQTRMGSRTFPDHELLAGRLRGHLD